MDARPQISILMPTYNGEPFLALALESVAQQTFSQYELLIRDDGSTDCTLKLIESFKVPQFRMVPKPSPRRGLFPNLNTLLKEAKAPLCQILCQDDCLEPEALAEIVSFWSVHEKIELLFTKNLMMDWEGNVDPKVDLADFPGVISSGLAIQHFFFHGCIPGNLSTVSFKTASAWALGGFDDSLKVSGDYDLWSRLVQTGPMGILQKPLVRVRGHRGQLSRQFDSLPQFAKENRVIRAALRAALPEDLRGPALAFEKKRHLVLDFHAALRAALRLDFKNAVALFKTLGGDLAPAAFHWLTTVNNRLRPAAPFRIPDADKDAIHTLENKPKH